MPETRLNYECFFTSYQSYQNMRAHLDDNAIDLLDSNKHLTDREYCYLNDHIEMVRARLMAEEEQMIEQMTKDNLDKNN